MPAYKNKENGSWYVVTQYTDWTGERKPKCKRGFATRREALEWEQKFQQQSAGDLDMSFAASCEIYTNDLKARLKESTWQTKENIIKTKLLPYFGKRKINEITTKDVIHTIPGIGIIGAATILAEIGDISRFKNSSTLVAFAGIDPTVRQSGEFNSTHNHMSKRGSPYLRHAIFSLQLPVLSITIR